MNTCIQVEYRAKSEYVYFVFGTCRVERAMVHGRAESNDKPPTCNGRPPRSLHAGTGGLT